MIKPIRILLTIVILLVILVGCGPRPNIEGNVETSQIIVYEKLDLITFYALIENTGAIPSKSLYAKFEIHHPELATELGSETIVFSNDGQIPRSFTISGDSAYFISQSFTYETHLPHDELSGVVEVVVFNDDGDEVTRFSIEQVITE